MTKATVTTARAFRALAEVRRVSAERVYKVTSNGPEGRRVRFVAATPGDLTGIKAAFYQDTGTRPDTPVVLFLLPE